MKRLLTVHGSSNVKMIGYDFANTQLDVVYHATPDKVHRFDGISPVTFALIVSGDSMGKSLATAVAKARYRIHALPADDGVPSVDEVAQGPVVVTVPQAKRGEPGRQAGGAIIPPKMTDEEAFDAVINRARKKE